MDYENPEHRRGRRSKSSGKTGLVVAIIAIVVILVGAGIGFFVHTSNQEKKAAAAEKAKKANGNIFKEIYKKEEEVTAGYEAGV